MTKHKKSALSCTILAIACALATIAASVALADTAAPFTRQIILPNTHSGGPSLSGIESVHGFDINGEPTLFYSARLPGDSVPTLYLSQRHEGAWTTQRVPNAPAQQVDFI